MLLRRAVLGAIQVRSMSDGMNQSRFERIMSVYSLWKKYNIRLRNYQNPEEPAVDITRSDRNYSYFHHLSLMKGCPYIIITPEEGIIRKLKENLKGYTRNAFIRGLGLHEDQEHVLGLCRSTFFEILRAVREEDFSELAGLTLGGHETLHFHRSAAQKLTKIQRESLKITEDDLLGENGHIIKPPYVRDELGPFIHSLEFTNVDAVGNTYPKGDENKGDKVFLKYKLMMGGVYKFDILRKDAIQKLEWDHKIKTPKDYGFKWPRYTMVELDVCQEAYNQMPIKLNKNFEIYDFHVYSF